MRNVAFLLLLLLGATVSAQNISNVDFQQVGDEIVITYNLDERAPIGVYVSLDGGKSYEEVHSVRGDVGRVVLPGKKRIVWKVLYDIPEGLAGPIQFKVSMNLFIFLDDMEFEMVFVEGGTFRMGATEEQGDDADDNEKPVHSVTLSDYYIGKFEVTQGQWEKVMGTTIEQQRAKSGDVYELDCVGFDYPMYYVNWDDAQEFCTKLRQLTGKKYALPTEAQWEYAARGGVKSKGYKYSGGDDVNNVAWYNDNSGNSTHPIGTKQPNELGIYDMSGNVWEWCSDGYNDYSSGAQTDPTGSSVGYIRVHRGGGWFNWGRSAGACRVSNRDINSPGHRGNDLGFRVVCIP